MLLPTYTDVIQNNVVQGNDALIDIDRITTKCGSSGLFIGILNKNAAASETFIVSRW